MAKHNLAEIDLNLLVHLQLLLEEENVGKAAKRAGLSSSAMSRKLGRLRELFGDPLLVSHGRGVVCTAHGAALLDRVRVILADVRSQLLAPKLFDPATTTTRWTIAATDSTHLILIGELLRQVRQHAPGLILRFIGPDILFRGGLDDGDVEIGIGPRPGDSSVYMARTLYQQRFLTLARTDCHELSWHEGTPSITLDAFCAAPHGLISPRGAPGSIVDDALAKLERQRRVVAVAQHFAAAVELVQHGRLLVTMPSLIARKLSSEHDLCAVPPPLELPELTTAAVWHPRHQEDPGHIWLRNHLVAAACALTTEAPQSS